MNTHRMLELRYICWINFYIRLFISAKDTIMTDEKATGSQAERQRGFSPVPALQQFYDELDLLSIDDYAAKEKKLLRKIDLRLMPLLFLMIVMK
jgi:hypothetical protein